MKRIRRERVALLLLTILLCVPQFAVCESADEEALLLETLCGPLYAGRGVGTEGNRLAARLLADRLEAHGYAPLKGRSVFLLPFDQGILTVGETVLTATMKDGTKEALVYGKDYLFSGADLQIDGTFPLTMDVGKPDISAVLMADPAQGGRTQQGEGFAAVIFPTDTLPFKSLSTDEANPAAYSRSTVFRINMLRPAFERVRDASALEIRYNYTRSVTTVHNVVGVLPGKDRTKAVVVSTHFDGLGDQAGNRLPGALDNASGVTAVDAAMRALAGTEPPYDVIIAFTNAEEARLAGARDLAGKLTAQYDALYNINVDCVGVAAAPFSMQKPGDTYEALTEKMNAYYARYGFTSTAEGYVSADHIAFDEAGILPILLVAAEADNLHTVLDTPDRVDPAVLRKVADMIVDIITENPDMHALQAETRADAPPTGDGTITPDEMRVYDSHRWRTYEEVLRNYPALPLPETYKGCPIEACKVTLYPAYITQPDNPRRIASIEAIYSDGTTNYRLQFNAIMVRDPYGKQNIGEDGFLLIDWDDANSIAGIGLRLGEASLYLFDGETATLAPFEIEPRVPVHSSLHGTSKVTEENAASLLADPVLAQLIEALANYVKQ